MLKYRNRSGIVFSATLIACLLTFPYEAWGAVFQSTDTPRSIPDGQLIPIVSAINIGEANSVRAMDEVEINLEINHADVTELEISLIYQGSDGLTKNIGLFDGSGVSMGENLDITFSTAGTRRPSEQGRPPFDVGIYTSEIGGEFGLAELEGLTSWGSWTLLVSDDSTGTLGTLESWSLSITGSGETDPGGGSGGGESEVAVPSVAGLSRTAAESFITNAGLVVGAVTEVFSDTVESGTVISAQPASGTMVASGSTINLTVSIGVEMVAVPALSGLSQAGAESALSNSGLTVGSVTEVANNTVDIGDVVSSQPASDTMVARGSSVDLVISSGPEQVSVPSIAGFSQNGAENAIRSAGLSVGAVTEVFSDVAIGNVISQDPASGSLVSAGSEVNFTVSKGPDTTVPTPTTPGCPPQSMSGAIEAVKRSVGDFFLLGLSMVTLLGFSARRKG